MDYLPLVHRAWVHLGDGGASVASSKPVLQTGTLGAVLRWIREQPELDRERFVIGIQHRPNLHSYRELEAVAARSGTLGR